jgi:hypothetical protein
LKSQKFLGIGGFFSRLKDKGTLAKETWNTISSAIDAQMTMEEMAKMEEKGGEDWTDEKKVEYERRVTGKILNAAWRGSKFEIQGVLRDVCDEILNDKKVPMSKRLERAQALVISGEIYQKVCSRTLNTTPFLTREPGTTQPGRRRRLHGFRAAGGRSGRQEREEEDVERQESRSSPRPPCFRGSGRCAQCPEDLVEVSFFFLAI